MRITEVRVKMVTDAIERLRAFCSVTFDGAYVIRDLKVIDGANGPFVAMPSRKLTDRCPKCGCKNHLRARFCNDCGGKLNENRAPRDADGRVKLHADIAHPINADCREMVQQAVLDAFEAECEAMKDPNYIPNHEEAYEFEDVDDDEAAAKPAASGRESFEEFLADLRPAAVTTGGGKSLPGSSGESKAIGSKPAPAGDSVGRRNGARGRESNQPKSAPPRSDADRTAVKPTEEFTVKKAATATEHQAADDGFAAGLF